MAVSVDSLKNKRSGEHRTKMNMRKQNLIAALISYLMSAMVALIKTEN